MGRRFEFKKEEKQKLLLLLLLLLQLLLLLKVLLLKDLKSREGVTNVTASLYLSLRNVKLIKCSLLYLIQILSVTP